MSLKFSFRLQSNDNRQPMSGKIIFAQHETETLADVALKCLAYGLFYRDRLRIEPSLHDDDIPFVPDLVELDYEMRPRLWVECGECPVERLDRLAVKAHDAEIWVVKRSLDEVRELWSAMQRHDLRRDRYHLVGLDPEMFDEVCGLIRNRNDLFWHRGSFDPPQVQFELNGLWFDAPFEVLEF